ncbi:MAG: tryptophan 7-halogenase, partial [Proteobacteria bacterium]|nr:tryptophan 7-halogenase [Pseudomonadota bacterium]
LLDLGLPSDLAVRSSFFTHVEDNISDDRFDREKILITIHPEHRDLWYWLIPFSNGRSSIGAVVPEGFFSGSSEDQESKLKGLVAESGFMNEVLKNAVFDTGVRETGGYSCKVKQLYGDGFALLGNAGEFLDPVFSSGVTIALASASLSAATVDRQLSGLQPDWDAEYANPLMVGVDTFREFVEGWYDERFQDVIFSDINNDNVKGMVCSILAGYAWDQKNPYVDKPSRLDTLVEICRE